MMISIARPGAAVVVLFGASVATAAAAGLGAGGHPDRSVTDRQVEQRLVGTWSLVSAATQDPAGRTISYPYGNHPAGKLTYTSSHNVWALVAKRDTPKALPADAVWYTGMFDAHSRAGTVVHHVQYSNIPTFERTDLVRRYRFAGNRLTLTVSGAQSLVLTWQRTDRSGS